MKGNLYRAWPENKEIILINCNFNPGKKKRDFIVKTQIKASNKNEARILGKRNCYDSVNLLEFCIGEKIKLDNNFEEINNMTEDKKESNVHLLSKLEIVNELSTLTDKQLKEIKKVQKKLLNTEKEKKLILIKSLHWWALGKRESDNIDRFIKLWIALEVLVEGRGKKVVNKVKEDLRKLYPYFDQTNGNELVGKIYGMRGDIVHKGFRDPRDVMEKTLQLETIFEDLLNLHLNTKFKELTKVYLTNIS